MADAAVLARFAAPPSRKTWGQLLFRSIRTRRTPLCTPIFENWLAGTAVTAKNDNENERPACPERERGGALIRNLN